MFRLLLLTAVAHYSYASCGKHLPGQVYAPCPPKVEPPVVYAPPPPPPPVILKPLLLPELPAPHEFLRQSHRRSRHRHRSSSESPEYRDRRRGRKSCKSRCTKLLTCVPNTNCTLPSVKYINDNASCTRAIVTCYPLSIAQTSDSKILSSGAAIDNMLTCDKWGRWIAKDNQNQKIEVAAVGCYPPPAEETETTAATAAETTVGVTVSEAKISEK